MIHKLSLRSYGTRCIAFATIVVSLALLLAPNAKAQTTWTITVDATGSNPKPVYTVSPDPSMAQNCSEGNPNANPSAENLYICQGDTVQWVARTKKNGSQKMQSEMAVFHEDRVLLDRHNKSSQAFHASDGQPTDGGTTDLQANLNVGHKYYLAVFDKVAMSWHYDEPQIIIGKGGPEELLHDIQKDCSLFLVSIHDDKARERGKAICEEAVRKLKMLLVSK